MEISKLSGSWLLLKEILNEMGISDFLAVSMAGKEDPGCVQSVVSWSADDSNIISDQDLLSLTWNWTS